MKKLFFLSSAALICTALVIVLSQCGSSSRSSKKDATQTSEEFGWIFEGWACPPDAVAARRGESPAQYCEKTDDRSYLYMKFSSAASDRSIKSKRIAQMKSTCRTAARDQGAADALKKTIGSLVEQASGVADGQSTGDAIVSSTKGRISGIGVLECCPLDPNTGECSSVKEGGKWDQCDCVIYLKYPGGQEGFEAKAKSLIEEGGGEAPDEFEYGEE